MLSVSLTIEINGLSVYVLAGKTCVHRLISYQESFQTNLNNKLIHFVYCDVSCVVSTAPRKLANGLVLLQSR